ncbi:MAG: helix-turn-helix transcriptional regulator [Bacteroidota bacterium]|jgi:transcriptional regulator with XRE-family HTH domain
MTEKEAERFAIGEIIANARKAAGLNCDGFSKSIGLSSSALYDIERGYRAIKPENLEKAIEVLKIDRESTLHPDTTPWTTDWKSEYEKLVAGKTSVTLPHNGNGNGIATLKMERDEARLLVLRIANHQVTGPELDKKLVAWGMR